MEHSFDVEVAKEYGIPCAIILKHMEFWIEKNRANERHYYDGSYWTYNSVKALTELFPYMSKNTIVRSIQKLVDEGLLIEGSFNKSSYDRTKWYGLTQKAKSICPNSEIHLPKFRNGITQSQKPIPDNIPDSKPDNNNREIKEINTTSITTTEKRFIPPTRDEVEEYCIEKGFRYVNPDSFIEFYESKGWMVGKNKMTNWRMSVSGWNRRAQERGDREYLKKPISRAERHRIVPDLRA